MIGKRAKILAQSHVEDLLFFAQHTRHPIRNQVIVLLSLKAGLRAAEIANLSWDMVVDPTGEIATLYVVLSLPIFRLVRSRSLSLGAWVPKNLARRRKPSAARCLLDLLGPPGRCSGCWPHDGEVAGGAVADFVLVISRSRRPRRSQVRGQLRHDPIATAG